jgi:hypothetical protein
MPTSKGEAMESEDDRAVVTEDPPLVTEPVPSQTGTAQETVRTDSRRVTATGPGASEMTRRIVVLIFGLVQLIIGLRIVLLLLNARPANGLVSWILNVSQVFIAPFDGILRTDYLHAAGSVLDITAIVALVGITILELIVIWAAGIFRRAA